MAATEFVTTECPNGHRVRGDVGWLDREVQCPHCHTAFKFTRPQNSAAQVVALGGADTNVPQQRAADTLSEAERVERLVSDTGVMRILSDYLPPAVSSDGSTRRCSHCGATYPGDVTTCYSCNIELGPPEDNRAGDEENPAGSIDFQAVAEFPYQDVAVRKVMRPRKEIIHLDIHQPLAEMLKRIRITMHSRYPLCDQSLDELVGIVHIKDLLNADEHQFDVRSVTKPPDLILDSTPVSEVVEHFANDQDPFAVVVDEYETIIGMVTPKDVLLKLEKK
jgi:CBS domain-containing protein